MQTFRGYTVKVVCKGFAKFYTYHRHRKIQEWKDKIFSTWISSFFCHVGCGTIISRGTLLQGWGEHNISIGDNTLIQGHCVLGCWKRYRTGQIFSPFIAIGDNCNIGEFTHITAINKITIGNGLLTGRFVYIGDNAHGSLSWEEAEIPPARRFLKSKGEIVIGNNVWIGDKATILGGVTIGDNVIIGAGSIVTHDIPSNSLAAGMPAKVIKSLENRK
ncbi:MAG: acyltransferase [Prevotella sp.]|nr:acyltransferase [Prevotella sp.]